MAAALAVGKMRQDPTPTASPDLSPRRIEPPDMPPPAPAEAEDVAEEGEEEWAVRGPVPIVD